MVAAAPARLRGVLCQHCGKAIRLSTSVLKRELAGHSDEAGSDQDLQSRVFTARCRHCQQEAIYSVTQIVELPQ
jgi:hypothetical protein